MFKEISLKPVFNWSKLFELFSNSSLLHTRQVILVELFLKNPMKHDMIWHGPGELTDHTELSKNSLMQTSCNYNTCVSCFIVKF